MWKIATISLILCCSGFASLAQQSPPEVDPALELQADWNARFRLDEHIKNDLNALIKQRNDLRSALETVTKERDELKAKAGKSESGVTP